MMLRPQRPPPAVEGLPSEEAAATALPEHLRGSAKVLFCVAWQRTGSCQYGRKCSFAHGEEELELKYRPTKVDSTPDMLYSANRG